MPRGVGEQGLTSAGLLTFSRTRTAPGPQVPPYQGRLRVGVGRAVLPGHAELVEPALQEGRRVGGASAFVPGEVGLEQLAGQVASAGLEPAAERGPLADTGQSAQEHRGGRAGLGAACPVVVHRLEDGDVVDVVQDVAERDRCGAALDRRRDHLPQPVPGLGVGAQEVLQPLGPRFLYGVGGVLVTGAPGVQQLLPGPLQFLLRRRLVRGRAPAEQRREASPSPPPHVLQGQRHETARAHACQGQDLRFHSTPHVPDGSRPP
ncbi:hypothetical protein ACFQ3Z_38390 [Streptomyces nogalater]